jgi:eukaryotic-like serine/threonine-protein kinase
MTAGTRVGPYEILAPIGAGGMGEVYRARDHRLNRDVAIKISKEQFTERFTREARAIAALNHTNICHLYDVGPNYLVMEYVEGLDLRGPMDFDDALPIIEQLIDGIEAAHEKNIVHRDLKPANIKITPEGVVKILDFGLAKAMAPPPSDDGSPENSPTITMAATQAGTILGTAAYMSPEQAKGKTADKRSDIWSFGVVLYQVLTGKRLFTGETPVELLGAVLNRDPDLSAAPPRVRNLLRWCLEKDRRKRLASISDARRMLEDVGQVSDLPSQAGGLRHWIAWIVAFVLLLALAAVSFLHFRETPPPEQTVRSTIAAPEGGTIHSFAISPDGRELVIAASVGGKRQLWLRAMDALQPQPIPHTEEAMYPFWSPDSGYIGFFAQGKLKKVAAGGGPVQSLCDAPDARGGSWNRDDVIVFTPAPSATSIERIPANGGVPVEVTKTKGDQRHPVFLPGGRHFLYLTRAATAEKNGVYVGSLDGTENRRVLADVSSVAFAPAPGGRTGHILFVRDNTLMQVPFNAASAQVSGDVIPVAEGVALTSNNWYLPASVSDNGVLVYEPSGAGGGTNQFGWYDRSGKSLGLVGEPGRLLYPAISPDEKSVLFERVGSSGSDLWVRDLTRGNETRFTRDASGNIAPFWSPKGDRIVFGSNRTGVFNLYQKAASGSAQDQLLLPNNVLDTPSQWSRDGRFIVYQENDPKNKEDLWVVPTEDDAGDRKPMPFLRSEFNELLGQLSPDSHWMAYTSDRSGQREVYVRPFPPGEGEWTISIAGGQASRWRGDGKELFFVAADGKLMAVPVKAAAGPKPSFEVGAPVALFNPHMVIGTDDAFQYDVAADGKRFLINTTGGPGVAAPSLTVVTNWLAGLNAGVKK